MGNTLYTIIYSFVLVASLLYIWHKLLNKKINFKDYKLYVSLVSIMIIAILNYFIIDKFIKIIVITVIFMFFFRYLFKESLKKCIITPIYYQLIIMFCETVYALILTLIFGSNPSFFVENNFGIFITNIIIACLSIGLVNLKFIVKLYNLVLKIIDKTKPKQLVLLCIIIIIALSIFPVTIYYKVDFIYLLIFYSTMIIACCIIVFYMLKTQNKYNKVSDKYNIAIKSLNDFEKMMTKYRVANHENKNLLLTVRAMILNNEKDIPKYIDSIVKEKYEDDEKLLFKMSAIPSGGLRATIYSEIQKLQANKIDYSLEIDSNLSAVDLIDLDTDTTIDICKILGVFIDNAMDEVKKLRKKNINISIYVEKDNLNIKVSNNYKNKIEVDRIFDEGYTTKGEGHGYGLSLVKKLVDSNKAFSNTTEITKDIFSQILSIKYKNKK